MTDRPLAQVTPHGAIPIRVRIEAAWIEGTQADAVELSALRAEPTGRAEHDGAMALLVPGYTGSKEDFAPLFDPLAAAGLGVLAVDLPGQHESGPLPTEQDHHPEPLGRLVAALVRDLVAAGHRVLLLGHSYGGLVARSAVLCGAPVTGLTLMSSGPAALPVGPRRALLDLAESVLRTDGAEAVIRLREAADGVPEPLELAELLRSRFLNSASVGLLGMAQALRAEPDRVGELATHLRTRCLPCLVVFGAADDAWSEGVQREMATRLGAAVRVIPRAGHSPNTECPRLLVEAVLPIWHEWLTSGAAPVRG